MEKLSVREVRTISALGVKLCVGASGSRGTGVPCAVRDVARAVYRLDVDRIRVKDSYAHVR